ncbi:TolC family protein [Rhodoferax sp. PAMC 29310]|uniref:TolC family protein n=1 Tax=Rhodoferax sp. PAMC 29310 TaxID=2822760 RepID=UPI001B32EDC9|nr:TolC family protein [Rhodoferax sp. PAMC 29310]
MVIFNLTPQLTWRALVLAMAVAPLALSAQTVEPTAPQDWRSANDTVGLLKRGHMDVLKWESANPTLEISAPLARQPVISLLTSDEVIRQAWRAHLDLARPLSQFGSANVSLVATGQWDKLDPSLQRRIDDAGEVLEVATQARKAWIQAIAASQSLAPFRAALDSAEAATELGQRMVNVGNWSKLKLAPLQLAQATAKMNWVRAQYAAAQAQASLIKALGLKGQYASVALPDRLPDLPSKPVSEESWRSRALLIQDQLPRANSQRSQTNTDMALDAYQASHALYQANLDVLKVRDFIGEETVLHYNGMLSSTWDLLSEASNKSQAVIDAIGAQRDYWLAESDLQWVLQGGQPDSFMSFGGGGEAAASAAH